MEFYGQLCGLLNLSGLKRFLAHKLIRISHGNIHAKFPFCVLEFVSIRNYFYFFTIYTLINAFLTQNKGLYFVRIHVYEVADYNTIPRNRFRSIQVS